MEFTAEDLLTIRAVAVGVLDEEISRLVALKAEIDPKLEALGGLQDAQRNIARAKSMFAEAEHAKQLAAQALEGAHAESVGLRREASTDRHEAQAVLAESHEERNSVAGLKAQLHREQADFDSLCRREEQKLKEREASLQIRDATVAAQEKELAEKLVAMRRML